jgi:hypothetical protein
MEAPAGFSVATVPLSIDEPAAAQGSREIAVRQRPHPVVTVAAAPATAAARPGHDDAETHPRLRVQSHRPLLR